MASAEIVTSVDQISNFPAHQDCLNLKSLTSNNRLLLGFTLQQGGEEAVGKLLHLPMIVGKSLVSKNHVARAPGPERGHTTNRKHGVNFMYSALFPDSYLAGINFPCPAHPSKSEISMRELE